MVVTSKATHKGFREDFDLVMSFLKTSFFLSFFFFKLINIYFWLLWVFVAVRAFSSCGERGLLFVAVWGLLIAVASLVAEHRL